MNDPCLGKSCSLGLLCVSFACLSWACVKFCVCPSVPSGIEGRMWDMIVLIPDHSFSIYFSLIPPCRSDMTLKCSKGAKGYSPFHPCMEDEENIN